MSVTISFTSPGNPPNNITQFKIERSERSASGTIAAAGDVNNVTKVINVTFNGIPPADGALEGDQMHINGLLYRIVTNTSTSITFTSDTDLSTISTFPATFIVFNDLAEFEDFEEIGTVSPSIPFTLNTIHQYTDSNGTMFDYYRIKSVDSGGTVSVDPLSDAFRPGQVVTLTVDERRLDPKDALKGIIGGSITFEVEVIMGGRRQDPKNNKVYADIFMPSYLSDLGKFQLIETLEMTRVGPARYRVTWNIPTETNAGTTIRPGDDYVVSYKGNFMGLVDAVPDNYIEFDNENFQLDWIDAPIHGRFPAYATVDDLRMTLFEIDAYLPEAIEKSDLDGRNKVLQYHLEQASDKLREELNMHQLRSNSADRREYVCARSIYTLLMAAKGQNSSAVANEFLDKWKERAEYILAQLKREGISQGIPLGRG